MDTSLQQKIDTIEEKNKKYILKKNYVSVPVQYKYNSIWASNKKDFVINESYISKLFTNPIKFTGPLKLETAVKTFKNNSKIKNQFIKTIELISKYFYNSKTNNLYLKGAQNQIKCSFIIEPNNPHQNDLLKLQDEASDYFDKITLKNGKYYLIFAPLEIEKTSLGPKNKDVKC